MMRLLWYGTHSPRLHSKCKPSEEVIVEAEKCDVISFCATPSLC